MILRLARAAEFRSNETGFHIIRVGYYSKVLSENVGMDKSFTESIFLTSPLHDLGKIGIPDKILLKEGKLSNTEWEIMKTHCTIGVDLLKSNCFDHENSYTTINLSINKNYNKYNNPLLEMAAEIAGDITSNGTERAILRGKNRARFRFPHELYPYATYTTP